MLMGILTLGSCHSCATVALRPLPLSCCRALCRCIAQTLHLLVHAQGLAIVALADAPGMILLEVPVGSQTSEQSCAISCTRLDAAWHRIGIVVRVWLLVRRTSPSVCAHMFSIGVVAICAFVWDQEQ